MITLAWVIFLKDKTKALKKSVKLCRKFQILNNLPVVAIRIDHRREFDQDKFIDYYDKNDNFNNFSAPRTSQQNGVVKRKNRTLEDMARTLSCENNMLKSLWAEVVNM